MRFHRVRSILGFTAFTASLSLFGCTDRSAPGEMTATETQDIIVTPTNGETARNRVGVAAFNNRTYVGWVGTDENFHINVASTPACPLDTWPDATYQKTTFDGERGSDDDKAGISMAASPDGQRLFLVYTGFHPNNVYLKWMFLDQGDGGTVERWSAPITLPGSGSEDDAPGIAVNNGSIYVAFTDTDNFIRVVHASIPQNPPAETDVIAFDDPVVLPHDGQVHRTDNGPSITFYTPNSGDPAHPAPDQLLLAYITQTQCADATSQGCRNLVLDFLDTSSPAAMSQPSGVEFSKVFDNHKDEADLAYGPGLVGVSDGVVVAFRQDRNPHGGSFKDINAKHFTADELTSLALRAANVGPGNVLGDETDDERGLPLVDGVDITGQSTPNDPNLGLVYACKPADATDQVADTVDTTKPKLAALAWRGTDEHLNVGSNVDALQTCEFLYNFDDTTDHTPAYANARFEARKEAVVGGFACQSTADEGASQVMARIAYSQLFPGAGDQCPSGSPGEKDGKTMTAEAIANLGSQADQRQQLGSGDNAPGDNCSNGSGWDVPSSDFMREYFLTGSNTAYTDTRAVLKDLVNGIANDCNLRENPVGPFRSGDESVFGQGNETENHLLFIESNRFLYNQVFSPSDNTSQADQISVQQWLQQRLQAIIQNYFYEFNSQTYEKYHTAAILNLFDNATSDTSIQTEARMVLDLLAAHETASTKDLRRMAPYRRHPEDWDQTSMFTQHQEAVRFEILTGANRMLENQCPAGDRNEVATALSSYRIPDPILDRLLNRAHQRGFARLNMGNRTSVVLNPKHNSGDSEWQQMNGWEVYYQDPDFLISGGGIAAENQYGGNCSALDITCAQENENAQDVYTLLVPTGAGTTAQTMLRFEQPRELGTDDQYKLDPGDVPPSVPLWRKTCVGPNFACGEGLVIPSVVCQESVGGFTFVDFTSNCANGLHGPDDHGFYAATFHSADGWGFFEAEGVKTIGPSIGNLQQFEQAVLARNGSRSFAEGATNVYTTLQGDTITFAPLPLTNLMQSWNLTGLTRDCSTAINPAACRAQAVPGVNGSAEKNSQMASGDFFTNTDPTTGQTNKSRVWVTNPYTCSRLGMDASDATNAYYVDPQNTSQRLCDPVNGQCASGCTPTANGTCSCPVAMTCAPPHDVTGPLPPASCLGAYAQFGGLPSSACPTQIAIWSGASSYGNPTSTFGTSSGGNATVVLNGQAGGSPSIGFEIDYPSPPTTVPAGCHAPTTNAPNSVTCDPVNGTLALSPGRYGDLIVNSGGTLVLQRGDYMFDSLMLNSSSTLVLPLNAPVRIITLNGASVHPQITCSNGTQSVQCNQDSVASNFGIFDLGTSDVFIEGPLAGTVIAPNATIRVQAENGQPVHGSFWSKKGVVIEPPGRIIVPPSNVFFNPNESGAYATCPTGGTSGGGGSGSGGASGSGGTSGAGGASSTGGSGNGGAGGSSGSLCAHPTTISASSAVETISQSGTCFAVAASLLGRNGALVNFTFPQGVNAGSYTVSSFRTSNDNATQCALTQNSVTNNQLNNVPIGPSSGGVVYFTLTANNATTTQINVAISPWVNGSGCSSVGPVP